MTDRTETNDTDQDDGKKLLKARPGRLELKKTVDAGQVRQSFSHGRTKSVAVEVRRKRTFRTGAGGAMTEVKEAAPAPEVENEAPAAAPVPEAQPAQEAPRRAVLRTLTDEETKARARALRGARDADGETARVTERVVQGAEARRAAQREAEEARRLEEERRREEAEAQARRDEEERRRKEEEEVARKAAEQAAARAATPEGIAEAAAAAAKPKRGVEGEEDEEAPKGVKTDARKLTVRRSEPRRRTGKLTLAQALDDEERVRSLASVRRARERERRSMRGPQETVKIIRDVVIPETITVQELANRMAERGVDVIKSLMKMGVMVTLPQTIDADTAELIVAEFGHRSKRVSESDVEIGLKGADDAAETLVPRPPVVTVMGHVDHGKTSLLDALRATNVAGGEAGGITQHIGAYQVRLESGDKITFIDTPGHAAFTAMRARGANVTDIVVLVVAADDGIMPQTVEAIDHAKAAGVPIIVAINKIDRPDANPARVRQELLQHELVVEELGGDILAVEVSAIKKTNLDKLQEAILLQSEVLELKANPARTAEGVVIEANLERGRGAVATMLVQRGTLKVGDLVVAGAEWGRVRALVDDAGQNVDSAGPSVPVEVLGLNGAPMAGDEFAVVDSEGRAREITEFRQRRGRAERSALGARGTLEQMFSQIQAGEVSELPLIIKTDTHGSAEAIVTSLEKMATDEVKVRVLHSGVGGINESDVTLAQATNALVFGFNVRANVQARDLAKRDNVEIRYYSIIYNLTDDVRDLLSGMLAPEARETFLGNAEILEVFNVTKAGKVAGCKVTEGIVRRGASVRLLRDNVVIHEGKLATLKRFKDEVREVRDGMECGMAFENYQDIKAGDVIECFEVEQVARTL
ncbi:MAG: translation initiation factor IF-2 [Alphaproteobacteria bacterium]|nr:translation initiation factor IF-2 [Alphaproteobacteria bacterium]